MVIPKKPNDDDDGDGYTNLEEWLHRYAAEVEGEIDRGSGSPTSWEKESER